MDDTMNYPGSYRVEASGWGMDDSFFVEKTDLVWSESGDKSVLLRHALPEGALIILRLQVSESAERPNPVIYQVAGVQPMNCNGQCEMRLRHLHPRSKAPMAGEIASNSSEEDSPSMREPKESSIQLEPQEILQ